MYFVAAYLIHFEMVLCGIWVYCDDCENIENLTPILVDTIEFKIIEGS